MANPGCYPTSIILPLTPLLKDDLIDTGNIIADSKSGVSGAGRSLKTGSLVLRGKRKLQGLQHTQTPASA